MHPSEHNYCKTQFSTNYQLNHKALSYKWSLSHLLPHLVDCNILKLLTVIKCNVLFDFWNSSSLKFMLRLHYTFDEVYRNQSNQLAYRTFLSLRWPPAAEFRSKLVAASLISNHTLSKLAKNSKIFSIDYTSWCKLWHNLMRFREYS